MMTVSSRSPSELVNIKLHHARLLIQSASSSENPLQRALLAASVNELYLCYQALLAEVVHSLRVPLSGIQKDRVHGFPSASEWQSYLERYGRVSPEINRCVELERGTECGWLHELLSYFATLSTALPTPSTSSSPVVSNAASDVASEVNAETKSATKQEPNNRIAVTNLNGDVDSAQKGVLAQGSALEKEPTEKSLSEKRSIEKSPIENSTLDCSKLMQWQQNLKALLQAFRAAVAEW